MASGDQSDIFGRLRNGPILAPWWGAGETPVLDTVLDGCAGVMAWCYALIAFAKAQTRLGTASGAWLDIAAWDYLGARFLRRQTETDDSFRPRVIAEILRPRSTRAAIVGMLVDLTGRQPDIFEPWNPGDCGAYDVGTLAYAGSDFAASPSGWDAAQGGWDSGSFALLEPGGVSGSSPGAGCWGDLGLRNQIFITARRPPGQGLPNVAGFDAAGGGYNVGALELIDMSQVQGQVTDAEIYARIAQTVAAGTTAWTAIVT